MLPQSYLSDRKVTTTLKLATSTQKGNELLAEALTDDSDSTGPEAHFLARLHPVLDVPKVLLLGTLTNQRGQVVARPR